MSTSIQQQLQSVQQRILQQDNDPNLSSLEIDLTNKLTEALLVEATMIKQKTREQWSI